jgi:hypothetical protein
LIALEFDENKIELKNGISLYIDENTISYINAKSNEGNIEIVDNGKFEIINGNNLTYTELNETIKNFTSVDEVIDYLNTGSTISLNTDIDLSYYTTKFEYYINILPRYAKKYYNEAVYYSNNSYVSLKKLIFKDLVKRFYLDSGYTVEDNNIFEVYFPINYSIPCLVNSNTNSIYVSYDILVSFMTSNINVNNLKTICCESNFDDKIIGYKFSVTYLDDEKYVDEILIDKMYTLPYIKENAEQETVWVVNDEMTDIKTSGKNAGNPNIMMMSYKKGSTGEQVSYSTDDVINIEVLHTYEEVAGSDSFKNLLKQYSENDGIEKTFNYYLSKLTPIENENFYKFTISLPNINKIISENSIFERILHNTLLMTFVDLKISNTKFNIGNGNYTLHELLHGVNNDSSTSFITVYWHIVKDGDSYTWESINNPLFGPNVSDPNYPVLDLGSMFSFTDFVDYYVQTLMTPDEYPFSWILFDSTTSFLKNAINNKVLTKDEVDANTLNAEANNIMHLLLKPDTYNYYSTSITNIKYDNYKNNLNFAPKFIRSSDEDMFGNTVNVVDYGSPENATEIKAIHDSPSEYAGVKKFFELTERKLKDISKVNNDFVPNADESNNYPMFDLREMLSINQSLLNRLNIISIGPDKRVYNAYIGHPTLGVNSSDYDYDVIAIGSYRQNHNMNSNITLTNSSGNFSKFDRIRFDLPTFNNEQAIFDKLVLHKIQGESAYYAIISINNTSSVANYINYYKEKTTGGEYGIYEEVVAKKTKFMTYDFKNNTPSDFININSSNIYLDGDLYKRRYLAFNAAKYINDMDKMQFVIFDDDPEYPRAKDQKYEHDGYIIKHIPEGGAQFEGDNISTEDVLGDGPDFTNIKMLAGFDNNGGIKSSNNTSIYNMYTTFICYFMAESDNNKKISVGETGYSKEKLWLTLKNIQEVITSSKYIQ